MKTLFLLASAITYAASTVAQTLPVKPQKGEDVTGQQTRIWLQIQSQNMLATSHKDTLTPQAAKATQQRVEKSFSHAIPEKFIKNDFGE